MAVFFESISLFFEISHSKYYFIFVIFFSGASHWECTTCQINFLSENFLQRHLRIEHNPCMVCEKLFSMANLKKHQEFDSHCKMVLSENNFATISKTCEVCKQIVFVRKRAEHYQGHKQKLKSYFCIFDDSTSLTEAHFRLHLPLTVACSICEMKFRFPKLMKLEEFQESCRKCLTHLENCWATKVRELDAARTGNDIGEKSINVSDSYVHFYLAIFHYFVTLF